jgi:hypothetical protein
MRKSIIMALVAIAVTIGVGSAAGGSKNDPKPLPPGQAQKLIDAGYQGSTVVQAPQVDPSVVVQAGEEPGAITEGTAPNPSPLAGKGTIAPNDVEGAGGAICFGTATAESVWSTWPYDQHVYEDRYWCANRYGGTITYRVSHVRGASTLCSWGNAYGYKWSGGVGYTWVAVKSGATFTCPTNIPYVNLHLDRWQIVSSNGWGTMAIESHSG